MSSYLPKRLGKYGEELAARYLQSSGYLIRARNYRLRCGEVDIIAEKDDVIAFVEVKTRTSTRFGTPLDAVDRRKQRQLSRLAAYYLQQNREQDKTARFDVLAIILDQEAEPIIELVADAFDYIE
ncbi:MAG: YraN family protein [Desulfobulbus propionicus]|nr:MAG: YraN family protein [Desulfobulbus propionicus]